MTPRRVASELTGVGGALMLGGRMMAGHPFLALVVFVVTAAQGVLQGALVYILREVLVGFSHTSHVGVPALLGGAVVIFGMWLARAAATAGSEVLAARLAHDVEMRSMNEVIAKLLTLPVRFFDKNRQGDLVLAAYHDVRSVRQLTLDIGFIVQHVSRLVGLAVVAWVMSPALAVIGLVLVPVGVAPVYWIGRRLTDAARRQRESVASIAGNLLEISAGVRPIKVNRAESRMRDRARATSRAFRDAMVNEAASRGAGRFLFEAVSGLGLVVIITIGGREVAEGRLQWETLLALLISIVAVYGPMISLLTVYGNIRVGLPTLDRVRRVMDAEPEVEDVPGARPLLTAPSVIELDAVSFSYDGQRCLDGVSARIHRGETIGVVGPSGAGKSTLLSLMLRFYHPTAGAIRFDGVDLREIRHADLMQACALVQQEPFLFDDTIANNIRLGRPGADQAAIVEAARAAALHDEIMEMEQGYDTPVGRGMDGRGLSGGQKQRLCIAAALLKNAPLLFLDEATSSLDSVSEEKVQLAIDRLMEGRTTFVVAHRLSTLRNADRILVLDAGRVAGFGSHAALLEDCPIYRSLWETQRAGHLNAAPFTSPAIVAADPA
ncbi:MAG TPA: ABC transporter ATP-binding protein [Gemmatimonadales bacterium]|jgi:subfamily B ATP-binding cassette protein MsbA|nr:ABC transporter ATP-binding protein [Gemmatimonadales bacterium]